MIALPDGFNLSQLISDVFTLFGPIIGCIALICIYRLISSAVGKIKL